MRKPFESLVLSNIYCENVANTAIAQDKLYHEEQLNMAEQNSGFLAKQFAIEEVDNDQLRVELENSKINYNELDDINIELNEKLAKAVLLLKRLPHLDVDPAYEKIREFLGEFE